MAIENAVSISLTVEGDGVETVFKFDLEEDPYQVNPSSIKNWFADGRHLPAPIGVRALFAGTATLSGTVVTLTFATPPTIFTGSVYSLVVLFAGR